MKATDAYRKINNSPIKGIVLYYTEQILKMDKVALGSVIEQIQTGKTPPKANAKYYSSSDVNWFKPSDIGYEKYLEEADEKFSNIAVKEKKATIYPKDTLLLIGIGGGVGRVSILKEEGSSNQQITGITFNEKVCPQYAYYYYLVREDYIKSQAKSMSFPILNQNKIKELEFRYPSIPEQNEFVKFIDTCWNSFLNNEIPDISSFEISPELKEYALIQFKAIELDDKIQKNIVNELKLLSKFKQCILQEAIQGKLTADWRAQNPNTEPASELLKRIKAEKAQLIKDKKIKKEKALPPITDDEIPFELPDGWVWCRMQEAGLFERGKSKHRPRNDIRLFDKGTIPFVQTGEVARSKDSDYLINNCSTYYNDFGLAQSRLWPKGTMCITIAANIAQTGFLNIDACFPDSVVGFTALSDYSISKYIRYFIDLTKTDIEKFAPATAQKNINLGIIYELKLPLPPEKEIKAIVEKVETLMQKCQALEQVIKSSEAHAQMLMQAVLKEAFEGKKEVVC